MRELARELRWESGRPKADRWEDCGRSAIEVKRECIHQGDGDLYVPYRCDLRTCPECARKRQGAVAAHYSDVLVGEVNGLRKDQWDGKGWKLVTLTRHNPGGYDPRRLREQVQETRRLFRDFWYRTWGSYRAKRMTADEAGVGCVWAVEVAPPSKKGKGGMVHVHALVYGQYWPQEELSELWRELTGDSYVVDIRQLRVPVTADPREAIGDAVAEVLKYATKPPQSDGPDHLRAVAAIEYAFDGTRRLGAFGLFYGKIGEYTQDEEIQHRLTCPICGAPAHAGDIHGPDYVRKAFSRGARWHPEIHPPPGGD